MAESMSADPERLEPGRWQGRPAARRRPIRPQVQAEAEPMAQPGLTRTRDSVRLSLRQASKSDVRVTSPSPTSVTPSQTELELAWA